ncbi:MAG: 5-formyltetrahydrofolate cyclo-ligase [Chlorobiaceae bacterium]
MDRNANITIEKKALRAIMIARRRSITEKSRIAMSWSIAGHVIGLPEILNAGSVHLYLSIPDFAEVSTAPIIDKLAVMNKQLLVPVIRNGNLVSAAFKKGDSLRKAQFGQLEPEVPSFVDESHLDVVLLPLLAFDSKGYRLGYGKGFYDRFLKRLSERGVNPCRIGLSFFQQKVDELPADPWDEPLDAVVHEHGIIRYT